MNVNYYMLENHLNQKLTTLNGDLQFFKSILEDCKKSDDKELNTEIPNHHLINNAVEQLENSLFKTKDTTANFILLEFSHEKIANKFVKFLHRNKITVRHLASYHLPKHVRMTIGNLNEMKKTIKVCNSFNV